LGHIADVCSFEEFDASLIARRYDLYVFQRPKFSRRLRRLLTDLRRRGKRFAADYDDLIFDARNALQSSLYLSGRASKRIAMHLYENYYRALRLFEQIFVSTEPLAREVMRSHPQAQVRVIHNGLSRQWVDAGSTAGTGKPERKGIAYFSGTGSHNLDFKLVQAPLASFVNAREDVGFDAYGELDFNREDFEAGRVRCYPPVRYAELPEQISRSWITIAPLQDNQFNRCKSGLKFFESAAFGVPCIASPIPDMQRFAGSGLRLAANSKEWAEALTDLEDPREYQRTRDAIRAYAMEQCMSMSQTQRFLEVVEAWR
jgi:glycosyltransferase involved in cell wall biosynthesis